MEEIYLTNEDDTWDIIAHRVMGPTKYTNLLINENITLANIVFFDAGVEIIIPSTKNLENTSQSVNLPPWLSK